MLFGSTVLEIAISLFFIYLLLSLLSSALNEWIAGYLKLRGRTLREGVENLLADPVLEEMLGVSNLTDKFYAHPLIRPLGRGQGSGLPSYIPGRDFTRAMLDLLLRETERERPPSTAELYKTVLERLTDLSSDNSDLSRTLLILVEETGLNPRNIEELEQTLQEIQRWREALHTLAESAEGPDDTAAAAIRQTISELETGLRQTEADIQTAWQGALTNVETYFDDAMDRVSGWYKRRIQKILIVIALLVTLLLNVDTLAIVTETATNAELRTILVDSAVQSLDTQDKVAETSESETPDDKTPDDASQEIQAQLKTLNELQDLGLPIGWNTLPSDSTAWLLKILGLLITAVAVSFGAPFWFDLLNKLVNLRMAGQKSTNDTG